MEEGEEIVRLCKYVDVYYNDRITGDIEFSEGSAKPQEITKFGLRTGDGDQLLSATQKYGAIPLAQYEEMKQRQVTLAVTNLGMRKHVEIGDFVISMRSMDGGLARAHAEGCVRSSYSVLMTRPNVDGRFYGALLKSSLYIQALRQTANFIRDVKT